MLALLFLFYTTASNMPPLNIYIYADVSQDERQQRRIGWPPFNSIASSKLGRLCLKQLKMLLFFLMG